MCVSVVGKIIEINGDTAKVDVNHNICEANISLISPKIGDYVLMHAGCILELLKKDTADELLELFAELEDTL